MADDGGGGPPRPHCHNQQVNGDPAPVARSLPRLAEQGGGGGDDGVSDALSEAGPTRSTKRRRATVVSLAKASRYRALAAPPLLWLVLRDGTYLTLPDGTKHQMPIDYFDDVNFCLSTGSLLFLVYCDRSCCLMNPSTGKTTLQQISLDREDLDIMRDNYERISKVVVSDRIVALLASDKVKIFTRGKPRGTESCSPKVWVPPGNTHVIDIAIFQQKLYILIAEYGHGYVLPPELHVLDTSHEETGVSSVQCIRATPRNCVEHPDHQLAIFFYLVPSGRRLLLVERQIDVELSSDPFIVRPIRSRIEVSEAVDLNLIGGGSPGHWSKVDTLIGRALFVSLGCSVSVPAQPGAQEDCVYFMTERKWPLPRKLERRPEDNLFECIKYNMRDKTVTPLSMETAATEATHDGIWHPTWLFPANA
uniref:Uncharacterized protein n=1 Tax=Avena sativa TaxID=4498 RepID=A0ACD5VBJ0_AVESA